MVCKKIDNVHTITIRILGLIYVSSAFNVSRV